MYDLGEELLAGAALAGDKHSHIDRRHLQRAPHGALQLRVVAYDAEAELGLLYFVVSHRVWGKRSNGLLKWYARRSGEYAEGRPVGVVAVAQRICLIAEEEAELLERALVALLLLH